MTILEVVNETRTKVFCNRCNEFIFEIKSFQLKYSSGETGEQIISLPNIDSEDDPDDGFDATAHYCNNYLFHVDGFGNRGGRYTDEFEEGDNALTDGRIMIEIGSYSAYRPEVRKCEALCYGCQKDLHLLNEDLIESYSFESVTVSL